MATERKWGRLLNKWHDEVGVSHLMNGDGSPACGVSYLYSTGAYPHPIHDNQKCKRCLRIKENAA